MFVRAGKVFGGAEKVFGGAEKVFGGPGKVFGGAESGFVSPEEGFGGAEKVFGGAEKVFGGAERGFGAALVSVEDRRPGRWPPGKPYGRAKRGSWINVKSVRVRRKASMWAFSVAVSARPPPLRLFEPFRISGSMLGLFRAMWSL